MAALATSLQHDCAPPRIWSSFDRNSHFMGTLVPHYTVFSHVPNLRMLEVWWTLRAGGGLQSCRECKNTGAAARVNALSAIRRSEGCHEQRGLKPTSRKDVRSEKRCEV